MGVRFIYDGVNKLVPEFNWDDGNVGKCQKHGVSCREIEAALNSRPTVAPDLKHSSYEQRFIAVQRNAEGRPMFIAFTYRDTADGVLIRPVSARYMHKKEAAAYEKSTRAEN